MFEKDAAIHWKISRVLLAIIVLGALLGVGYLYAVDHMNLLSAQEENATLAYQATESIDKLKAARKQIENLTLLNDDLKKLLEARVSENSILGSQNQQLNSTVAMLDKLANTDKELLEKYSSVYFLNENYEPKNLADIPAGYLARPEKPEQFLAEALPHLMNLLRDANDQHFPMQVLSGYRSYGTQANLKKGYKVTYGSGTANSFSADQGYSEHQLGTTVDFTTPAIGATLTGFDKTTSYAWLQDNAYKYGFILSYPKGNEHFVFEPWHWRYVGVELATRLHEAGKNFYDLDQRDIDAYLLNFFD